MIQRVLQDQVDSWIWTLNSCTSLDPKVWSREEDFFPHFKISYNSKNSLHATYFNLIFHQIGLLIYIKPWSLLPRHFAFFILMFIRQYFWERRLMIYFFSLPISFSFYVFKCLDFCCPNDKITSAWILKLLQIIKF